MEQMATEAEREAEEQKLEVAANLRGARGHAQPAGRGARSEGADARSTRRDKLEEGSAPAAVGAAISRATGRATMGGTTRPSPDAAPPHLALALLLCCAHSPLRSVRRGERVEQASSIRALPYPPTHRPLSRRPPPPLSSVGLCSPPHRLERTRQQRPEDAPAVKGGKILGTFHIDESSSRTVASSLATRSRRRPAR